jgi:excisionase family DNA binding protein
MALSSRQNSPSQGARSRYRPTPAAPGSGPTRPAATTTSTAREEEPRWPPDSPPGRSQAQAPTPRSNPEDPGRPGDGDPLAGLPEVLRVREVAAILRVGRNQLYEAVARGELPAVRIGRTIRIPTTALRDLLAASTHRPGGTASPS